MTNIHESITDRIDMTMICYPLPYFNLFDRFSKCRFVRREDLLSADLPLLPAEFEELVKAQCAEARKELQTS